MNEIIMDGLIRNLIQRVEPHVIDGEVDPLVIASVIGSAQALDG